MAAETQPKWRGFVALLGLFAGLCAVFALIVTAAEAWLEHAQAQWPEGLAQVQRCDLDVYTHKPEAYRIDCSLSYVVGGDEIISHVYSRSTPAPRRVIWQYPPLQFERMQEWVDEHPQGTAIAVHYNPANNKEAVLIVTDMPLGGPRTPGNMKLVAFFAAISVVLLTIARTTRLRSAVVSAP